MFLKSLFRLLPRDPLTAGLEHFNKGRLSEAIEAFAPLLTSDDSDVAKKARLFTCEAYLQLGDELKDKDPDQARPHYEIASDLQPTFADIHNKLGEVYMALGRLEDAEEQFALGLEINPRYFVACLNLCQVRARSAPLAEVAEDIKDLAAWCPPLYREALLGLARDASEARSRDWDAAFSAVRDLSPSRAEVGRQAALAALQRGDAQRAVELLGDLIRENPRFPDLHHLLGLARGHLGQQEGAVEAFQAALAIKPHYLKARINLGITFMELDRFEEAREQLRLALETDPANTLARSALEEITALETAK